MKNKLTKKRYRHLSGIIAATVMSSSIFAPTVSLALSDSANETIEKGMEVYEKYEEVKDVVDTADKIINGYDAASSAASGATGTTGGVDALGAFSAGYSLVTGDLSDIGSTANSIGDLSSSLGDAGTANAMGVIGSVFGQKLSDSVTYRSVGNYAKLQCSISGSISTPTINENFGVKCTGIPMNGTVLIVPPTLSFSDTPKTGGKRSWTGAVQPYTQGCHKGRCWLEPQTPSVVYIEYNTYEGDVTMGSDLYFDGSSFDYGDAFSSDGSEYEYTGSEYDFSQQGSLSDALSGYYSGSGEYGSGNEYGGYFDNSGNWHSGDGSDPYAFMKGDSSSGGYYDANGNWISGGSTSGSGGYYDSEGNWHGSSSGGGYYDANGNWVTGDGSLDGSGSAYDWNGSGYSGDINGDLYDGDSSFNAGGADWASSGSGGYYDADGNWHSGNNPYEGGHYDSSGNWVEGDSNGYYDASGNWVNGDAYGSDNLDSYFGGEDSNYDGNFTGSSGMSDDLTGFNAINATMSAVDALANGGYVGADGIIYDAEGNAWGSASAAGLQAFEEGSDELNNILAQGGWINENGVVFDANGRIVGYVVPAGSLGNTEANAFDEMGLGDQGLAMLQELLNGVGGANGGEGSLMERLGMIDSDSVLASLKSTFGLASSEDIKKETMTPQQMYDFAAKLLKELGYNDMDILKGANYDKDSAYTEPEKAWDMNRITTMQKHFKIDTGIRPQKKSSLGSSAGKARNFAAGANGAAQTVVVDTATK